MNKYNVINIQKRLIAIVMLSTFVVIALFARLFVVQIINGNGLKEMAISQWERSLTITAKRGTIYDYNGLELAVSYTTYDVYTRSINVEDSVRVATVLSDELDLDFNKTLEKVKDRSTSEVLIKMQVEKPTVAKILKHQLKGIYFAENNKRYYPYSNYLTQVLGFTTIDNEGQSGLEAYYNSYLKGTDGYTISFGDVRGKEISVETTKYIAGIDGLNIQLTIDVGLQSIIEEQLPIIMSEQKAKGVSITIMNPNTGEILAMASSPNFDLNNPPRENVAELFSTSKNKTITDVYEPGSTFKILTMGMALESGVAKLEDTFYDPGYRIVDGQKIKCWKSIGHGHQTLTQGLCNSCNAVFIDLALRLGQERFYSFLDKFGFGQLTGIDFYGESAGIVMNSSLVKNVDLARMGFGQAVAVTPLQQITAISCALNGGNLMKPYFVKRITSSSGQVVMENTPTVVRKVLSSETSSKLRVMLEEVVSVGTGKYSFVPGYCVSGKTGTTQKYENGKISGTYIASFVGAYPADKPEYILLICVDEPNAGSYYGSIVASPYAKKIFSNLFTYKNIAPLNIENDYVKVRETISMPYVEGLSLAEAVAKLNALGLQVEIAGEGSVVTEQLPPTGTMLFEGAIVQLTT